MYIWLNHLTLTKLLPDYAVKIKKLVEIKKRKNISNVCIQEK